MKINTMNLFCLTITMVMLTFVNSLFAANYYSQGSGNFNTLANWNTDQGGGGSSPASIVAATDIFYIEAGHNIIVNDSVNIAGLDISGTLTFGDDATARSMWVNGTITVNASGSILVGATGATHRLTLKMGNLVNNGTVNLRPATSSRVVNLFTRGTVSLQGANTPTLNNLTVVDNAPETTTITTASRALNIRGNLTISANTTFNAGAFTHTLGGNFIRLGVFTPSTSTFEFNAPLVQTITSSGALTFHNLTVNGAGILTISNAITVDGNFLVSNNTTVTTGADNQFNGNWEVQSGSEFKATGGQTRWYGGAQNITIAGTVDFFLLRAQSGTKTITGQLLVTNEFYLVSGATINDGAAGQTHTFAGNVRLEGTANFTHKVILASPGGVNIYHNTSGNTISFGAADIDMMGLVRIGNTNDNATTLDVKGNLNLMEGELIIRGNASVKNLNSKHFTQATNTNLYCWGTDNYPTGFASYTHEPGSFVRYDRSIDQTVRGGINYPHLYLRYDTRHGVGVKTLGGSINIDGNLYVYTEDSSTVTFNAQTYDVSVTGNIHENFVANRRRVSNITQTGGTFTLNGVDRDQIIYRRETNSTYRFHNLVITNIDPTAVRTKQIIGDNGTNPSDPNIDFIVTGNFTCTNTSTNESLRMHLDLNNTTFNGENTGTFLLDDNVIALVGGSQFNASMNSFTTQTLHAKSTVRYDANTNITIPSITYGNLEFGGTGGRFQVWQHGIRVLGNISRVNGTPTFVLRAGRPSIPPLFPQYNPNHEIKGNWNLDNAYVDATSSGNGSPTVTFNGDEDQYIAQATFWHVVYGGASGTKIIQGNQIVQGNLTIGDGITVDASVYTYTVGGNWNNGSDGTFSTTTSTVTFNGSGNQTVFVQTGNGSFFNNITINKPIGTKVIANSDFTVKGNFILTENKGDFNLNNHTITIGGTWTIRNGCLFEWTNGAKMIFNSTLNDQLIRNYNDETLYPTMEFTGGAIKRLLDNPFKIEGDIRILGSNVRGEGINHFVKGNFVNSGGSYSHSATLHFNGADQLIDAADFFSLFLTGTGTKRLNGNLTLGGSLTIDNEAILDVSPNGGATVYNLAIERNWINNRFSADGTKTGQFIPRTGTVTFFGQNTNIYTGDSIKADHTGRAGKQFYNLVVNNTDNNTWTRLFPSYPGTTQNIRLANDLRVLNNFTLQQGIFYNYWDKMYVGGHFINSGGDYQMLTHYSRYSELYFEGTLGPYQFNPGTLHQMRRIEFLGSGEYQLQNDMTVIRSLAAPNFLITNGIFRLKNKSLSLTSGGTGGFGDLVIGASGEIVIDSAAELRMPDARTISNYGTFRIVGDEDGPAIMRSVSGTYNFIQHSGTTHAKYYSIENTRVGGMNFLGGTINTTNNFTNGRFVGGAAGTQSAYITLNTGVISINTPLTLNDVTFYSGPLKNIVRQTNTGSAKITFVNAGGSLQGAGFETDPDSLVDWTYPGVKKWTGGGGDGNWHTATNWSDGIVPDENSIVVLDNTSVLGHYTVTISANATARFLTSNGTASPATTLVINGAKLDVKKNITILASNTVTQTQSTDTIIVGGSWNSTGTYNPNTSVVKFTPANGSYTITTNTPFYDLVIAGTNGEVSLGSDVTVTNHIKVISGTLKGSNRTLFITGNWSSNFTSFDGGTGTVRFNRNDGIDQNIDGGTFNNVTFSGTSVKKAVSTLFFNGTVDISAGSVFNGGTQSIYVRGNWYNRAGNSGFVQTGGGTVICDGNGTKFFGDYYGNLTPTTSETTFNNLSFDGAGTKYIANSITVEKNLFNIRGSNIYVGANNYQATTITGTSGGSFNMDGGVMYLLGTNSFPTGFTGGYNITGGTVEYRGKIDQTITGSNNITYFNLNIRSLAVQLPGNSHYTPNVLFTKTVNDHLYVKNQLQIINQNNSVDAPTQLNMNNKDLFLEGALVIGAPIDSTLRQINWGTGTLYHDGAGFGINANVTEFNNIIKRGTGAVSMNNHIVVHGNVTFEDGTNLNMRDFKMVCDGVAKNFTMGANSYIYSYIPDTAIITQYAFPTGFASYSIDPLNTYYVRGGENQSILPGVTYGAVYLFDNNARQIRLHGNFNARTFFINNYDLIEFIDNGHDLYLGGYNNDLRNYTPNNTIYLDGTGNQRIYAGGNYTSANINNLVLMNGGYKTLEETDIYISGNVTIGNTDTLRTTANVYFTGNSFTNNGRFEHATRSFRFNGTNQSVNPGNNTFNEVIFGNQGVKTVTDNGFNIRNSISVSGSSAVTVNFGALTHNIGSTNIFINTGQGSSWNVSSSNLIFDRNGDQYIPGITTRNISFTTGGNKYLLDSINVEDLHVASGVVFRSSDNPASGNNFTVKGGWTTEGNYLPYENTVYFESNNTNSKTITSGGRAFHNVVFNSTLTSSRLYTMTDNMTVNENLTLNSGAHLKLGGQTLTLGDNDPGTPPGEITRINAGATLEVDAESRLLFNLQDLDPTFDIHGTLRVVGTGSSNATIAESASASDNRGIKMRAYTGSTLQFQNYSISRLNYNGFVIDNSVTIDPANNFSNGVWNGIFTGTQFTSPDPVDNNAVRDKFYYMQISANTSGIGDVSNVIFNHGTVPRENTHYNVHRPLGFTGTINFSGDMGGNMGVETYELDPANQVIWPIVTQVTWRGTVNADWFTAANWSPPAIPTANVDATIPLIQDGGSNPIISAEGAICRTLNLTNGQLTIEAGVDTVKAKRNVSLGANAILSVEDNATIEVFGDWSIATNATFQKRNSTVYFNRNAGSSNIYPRNSSFHNIKFAGGATYYLDGLNINFSGNFDILGGTVTPNTAGYTYNLSGNYNYQAGTFSMSNNGWFKLIGNNQTITKGRFRRLELNGSGITTFIDSASVTYNNTPSNELAIVVRNGATLALGLNGIINIAGNITCFPGSSIVDNGGTIWFQGQNWKGDGSYNGTGWVRVNGLTQFIRTGKFANLLIENNPLNPNSGKNIIGPVSLTGNFTVNCRTLNLSTHLVTNTSGEGSFEIGRSLGGNVSINVGGENNYPSGFSQYIADPTANIYYNGTVNQTVRGKTSGVEIIYGNLYLQNTNTKTLEGDIVVLGDLLMNSGATTLDANNNTITIGGNWTNNQPGATFQPKTGEVIFNGTTNQSINLNDASSNNFYKIRVNKENPLTSVTINRNTTVFDKLWVRSGSFIVPDAYTLTIGGDLVATNEGSFTNLLDAPRGTYILNKATGTASIMGNNSTFLNIKITGGATYNILDNFTISGYLEQTAGELHLNGNTLSTGAQNVLISGKFYTNDGGTLRLGNLCQFSVLEGGEVHIVGSEAQPATVTRVTGNYGLKIETGGKIHANNYVFEYMDQPGIHVKPGAIVDITDNFSNGTFTNPFIGAIPGICLQLENNQSFTGRDSIVNIRFPFNPGSGERNISKPNATGIIEIYQWSGNLAGSNFENDPYNLINWNNQNVITWKGGTGLDDSRHNWNVAGNWDLNRVPQPTDNVIIAAGTGFPCYIRNMPDTVKINSLIVNGPLYLRKDTDSVRRVLNVSGLVDIRNYVYWDQDSTILRFSGDFNLSQLYFLDASNGGTISIYGVGTTSMNGRISSDHLRVVAEKEGTINFPTQSNKFKYFRINSGATVNISHATAQLDILTSFENYGSLIQSTNAQIRLGSAGIHSFFAGSTIYKTMDFVAGTYNLTSVNFFIDGNANILNGATLNIGGNTLMYGHATLVRTLNVFGNLRFTDFGQAQFRANSKLVIQNPGTLSMLGDVNKDVIFTNQGAGRYEVIINSGGTIAANRYKFEYLHANGLVIQPGATIHATNNLSNGVYVYGNTTGCYIDFRNSFTDTILIQNVNFAQGALYNARRLGSPTGVINFRDAYGLKAGHYFEDDDLSYNTGKIVWTYTTPTLFWTGAHGCRWDNIQNWNPSALPSNESIIFIQAGMPRYPIISADSLPAATAFAKRLTIYSGASMTFANGKNLDVVEDFVNGGTFTIGSGSATTVKVGGTFANSGTLTHGGASTLELASPNNMELTLGGASVFNLTLNSNNGVGNAEFATRSAVTVLGNLTITAGKLKVTNSAHGIYVGGNFINTSGFIHGNGTLFLNGNVAQNITNSSDDELFKLSLSGSGTKTLTTNLKLASDITIAAVLNAGSNTINIKGDWKGNKTFNRGTSTVVMNGASSQFITKSEIFHNLVINNTANLTAITLQNIVSIANNITLTRGRIESGNTNTLTVLDNATMTGGGSNAYVVGYMIKMGDDDFTFPIGSDNVYAPIGISSLASSSAFKAVYFESPYNSTTLQAGLNKASSVEHWQLFRNSGTAQPFVTFHWRNGIRSQINNLDPLVAAYYQTSLGWKTMGKSGTTGTPASGTVTSLDRFTQFGYCGFGWSFNELQWTGTNGTEWSDPGNWDGVSIPSASTNVIIGIAANYPSLNVNATCFDFTIRTGAQLTIPALRTFNVTGNLTIESGATLDNLGQLGVSGHFNNQGTVNATSSTILVFNGAIQQNISNIKTQNVTFSGTGEKYLSGTHNIAGDLSISSSVRGQASVINLGGNWNQPSGTFIHGTSTVVLNGTAQQTITCPGQVNLHNLTINNSFATTPQITLSSIVLVRGHLNLVQGIVRTTSGFNLAVDNVGTSTAGSPSSFISGPMRKLGVQPFVFPLGKGNIWARMAISDMDISASASFIAEYFPNRYSNVSTMSAGIDHVSTLEYWDLSRYGGTGTAQPHVTLYWEDTARSKINTLGTLRIAHYQTNAWRDYGGVGQWTGAEGGPGTIKSTTRFSTFSPITFGSSSADDNPLPVELVRFNATVTPQSSVQLEWATASEYNNERFELDKSMNGINFERTATIRSKGNSISMTTYNFEDVSPFVGTSYYRLRQVDFDGTEKIFPMVSVNVSGRLEINSTIYPNPATDKCFVEFNQWVNQKVNIRVYNIGGKLATHQEYHLNGVKKLDISELTKALESGVYYINITTEGHTKVHKLMIK